MKTFLRSPIAVARALLLAAAFMAIAQFANADCTSPAGKAGDQGYAANYGTMVFCNGTNWVSMAGGVSVTVNTSGGGATPAGSSADVQFNSSGALAADTGNFTYASGLLKAPNISTTAITASGAGSFGTINSTGLGTLGSLIVTGGATITGQASITTISTTLIQVGNNGANCTSSLAGGVRYNSTSNTIDYCSGSAWLSLGPSATAVPAFSVNKNNTAQTVTAGAMTKLTFSNEIFDTNNNFDTGTSRFTPTVPGKYLITLNVGFTSTAAGDWVAAQIDRNGAAVKLVTSVATGASQNIQSHVTAIVDMNGSTDYIEGFGSTNKTSIVGGNTATAMEGILITMAGAGTGGTANPAGSTNDIQFNSGGLLAADTGNFTYASSTLSAPSILTGGMTATGRASLTTVSSTLIQLVSNTSTACGASLAGAQRYNSVSNTIDYCTGSAWLSLGPSATTVPAFLVNRNGTNQTVPAGTFTKLNWTNEVFDTNNNFASDKFTPTIPGKYQFNLVDYCTDNTGYCLAGIYKNGLLVTSSGGNSGSSFGNASIVLDMNGTTDYVEAYARDDGGTVINGAPYFTNFSGILISMAGGGGGGTANPAGSTNDVQFNSGGLLAADSGNFTYTTATGTLSATTVSTTRINMAPSVSTVISLNGGSGNMISSGSAVVSTSSAGSIGMFVGGSQRMIIGSSFFGFGTTAPSSTIDVNGLFNINPLPGYYTDLSNNVAWYSGAWHSKNGGPGTAISLHGGNQAGYTGDIVFFTTPEATSTAAGSSLAMPERMRIDSNGRVGIGVSTPSDTLDIGNGIFRGNIRSRTGLGTIGSNAINFYWSGSAAQLWVDGANIGNITVSSDRRVKTDITPLQEDSGLAVIEKMKPVSFHWKNKESGTNLQYGFIAQDMMKVLPDIVSNTGLKTEYTPDGLLRIDYNGLIAPMVKSIQELKADNDNLRSGLDAANDNIRKLEREIDAMKRTR